MAWETRNVKISALNDSKYIGISVYSVVITSASVVVIGTIISERATLAYISITSLILIATTSTLCLLFLPKIIAIRSNSKYFCLKIYLPFISYDFIYFKYVINLEEYLHFYSTVIFPYYINFANLFLIRNLKSSIIIITHI